MPVTTLNQNCQCTTLRAAALQQAWRERVGAGLPFAGYFAPYGVFLSAAQAAALHAAVRLLHEVTQRPAVADAIAAGLDDPLPRAGTHGVLMGYDFHFDGDTPRLIEINTNPCLECVCPLLARIIPYMVETAFKLTVDLAFPPPTHYPNTAKHLASMVGLDKFKF